MVADGDGVACAPGAVLLQGDEILAAGPPPAVGHPQEAEVVDVPDAVLVPALVNAHCHLDLSHLPPVAYTGDWAGWLETVRAGRATSDAEIAASVENGVGLARRGGTALVGDIAGAGSLVPLEALRRLGLAGVAFLEVFGLGRRQGGAVDTLRRVAEQDSGPERGVRLGLGPHAPYTCGPEVYRAAAGLGRPWSTHLAETPAEIEFVGAGTGPLRRLLEAVGAWDETVAPWGQHPVDALAESLAAAPCVAAHLNYVEPRHVEALSGWPVTVAYCPRASRYFGHAADGPAPHRYRQMLDAGVNVALGTDGLLCLDTPNRISVLDEMRLLHRRDGTDPVVLLRMATVAGAVGLGFDPALVTLAPGPTAGLLALPIARGRGLDPLRQIMESDDPPQWVLGPVPGDQLPGPDPDLLARKASKSPS